MAQEVAINEVMTSNRTTIADEDGDFEDWIELYNYGSSTINLKGFGISDDYENPFRWIFPDFFIEPGEFIKIWASGKDRDNPDFPLHTNFRISSDGEEVILTCRDSILIDELEPTTIPTDISYGRVPDGTGEWYYFKDATPGSENTTQKYNGILSPPEFSHKPGFYSEAFDLEISHSEPGVTIKYAKNGQCLQENSILYDSPINITDRSNQPNSHSLIPTNYISESSGRGWRPPADTIAKTNVIRVLASHPEMISSSKTKTFFVFDENYERYSFPVFSITTDSINLFGLEEGIYVPGDTTSISSDYNYSQRGFEWERPGHIEFFNKDGELEFAQGVGLRIHGGFSRRFPQKSLRIYARNLYGNNTIDYPLFSDENYDSYKRFILRNSGNDWGYSMFRDGTSQSLVRHLDFDSQEFRPSIVFINGEYWGIHNIRERYDKHYLERVYGIDPENIDLLTGNSVVKEGDNVHFQKLLSFLSDNDTADDEVFDSVKTYMDINNFIDYYSAQIYYGNTDWPQNNIDYWRLRTPYSDDKKPGHDGRFRWLMYDVDRSLNLFTDYSTNMIERVTRVHWSTNIMRQLIKNENFKNNFINRMADHLNTAFISERVIYKINKNKILFEKEIQEHIERWQRPSSIDVWYSQTESMIDFANLRPEYLRTHIREHFEIENNIDITLDVNDSSMGFIRINSIQITHDTPGVPEDTYPWTGIYFNGIPIELEAIAKQGYKFSHWEGVPDDHLALTSLTPTKDLSVKAHFVKDQAPVGLIYFWAFDSNMPNNTPLETIRATYNLTGEGEIKYYSALTGYPFNDDHPLWRKSSMERRNAPTEINYLPAGNNFIPFEDSYMRGLQVRQPFECSEDENENTMIFHMPTTGYKDIIFRFAAKDEDAANSLIIDYAIEDGYSEWQKTGLSKTSFELFDDFNLYEIDFSSIEEVNHNFNFKVRVRFDAEDMLEDDGNRVTFNNISLKGKPFGDSIIHYWHFNDLPDEILTSVRADYSSDLNETAIIEYLGEGDGYMDRYYPGSDINFRFDEEAGYALRVRNPSDTRKLLINSSSEGYDSLYVAFAVHRSPNGAKQQEFYYSPDSGNKWEQLGESYDIQEEYTLKAFDLSKIDEVNNNPDLKFKILFKGDNISGSSGNNRLDNITVSGVKTTNSIIATTGDNGKIDPFGEIKMEYGKDTTFTIIPDEGFKIYDVYVNEESVGAVDIYEFTNVTANQTIHAEFISQTGINDNNIYSDIKVFPNPSKNHFYIISDNKNVQELKQYKLFNSNGKIIYTGKIKTEKELVCIKNLSKGLYVLKIEVKGDDNIFIKIIKQ